jgi:hypothetical protein
VFQTLTFTQTHTGRLYDDCAGDTSGDVYMIIGIVWGQVAQKQEIRYKSMQSTIKRELSAVMA